MAKSKKDNVALILAKLADALSEGSASAKRVADDLEAGRDFCFRIDRTSGKPAKPKKPAKAKKVKTTTPKKR